MKENQFSFNLSATTNSPPTHDKEPSIQEIQRLQEDISKQLTELRDLLDNLVKGKP